MIRFEDESNEIDHTRCPFMLISFFLVFVLCLGVNELTSIIPSEIGSISTLEILNLSKSFNWI